MKIDFGGVLEEVVTRDEFPLSKAKSNWWAPGDNGPCGPDTEMFYDVTGNHTKGMTREEYMNADEKQEVVEIWNDVFMEYESKDGKVIGKLKAKNVDTGSGYERVVMVLQGKTDIFSTDLFEASFAKINELKTSSDLKKERIIADHTRTAVMLISDGVIPSNTDQGYILRRLIRRAVRLADDLGMKPGSLFTLADVIAEQYRDIYENVGMLKETIKVTIDTEEKKFRNTLSRGMKQFDRVEKNIEGFIDTKAVFELVTTYGFPIEMVQEIAKEKGLLVNVKEFNKLNEEHKALSRSGAEAKFKGGLGDTSEMSVKYHTTTHLLHQALRDVLGAHVQQKGSNITPERLRFDFAHTTKMTDEEKKKVEDIVNEKIKMALPVSVVSLPFEEAEKTGALHFFGEKYGDTVTVYYIGQDLSKSYSKEFCGGPHVRNTSELGTFKIQKEEAVSAGVRRIKAVLV
jgi:alanyl-tRNA synthetase